MSEFSFIYVFLIAFALCVAWIIIIRIREDKSTLAEEKEDFITTFYNKKKRMLEINMPKLSIQNYLLMVIGSPVLFTALLWFVMKNKAFVLALAMFSVFLPDFVIRIIVESRRKRYEERYVRALKAFASSLRSGLSIQQSVQEIIANPFIADEIKDGFRQIDSDIRVGISIEDAFFAFAESADNDDARDVASAIAMQTIVGGSEAKVVDTIAGNIEDRLMTKKRIRAIFSATDFMVNAFDILPFLALIIVYIGMPEYVDKILDDPLMLLLCIFALAFTVYGSFSIRKKLRNAKGGVQ